MKIFNLDYDTIAHKDFSVDYKGYNPEEVDNYLDLIIDDYFLFETKQKETEIMINDLKIQLKELKNNFDITMKEKEILSKKIADGISNFDVLNRLQEIEDKISKKTKE